MALTTIITVSILRRPSTLRTTFTLSVALPPSTGHFYTFGPPPAGAAMPQPGYSKDGKKIIGEQATHPNLKDSIAESGNGSLIQRLLSGLTTSVA